VVLGVLAHAPRRPRTLPDGPLNGAQLAVGLVDNGSIARRPLVGRRIPRVDCPATSPPGKPDESRAIHALPTRRLVLSVWPVESRHFRDRGTTTLRGLPLPRPIQDGSDRLRIASQQSSLDRRYHGATPPALKPLEPPYFGPLKPPFRQRRSPVFIIDFEACRAFAMQNVEGFEPFSRFKSPADAGFLPACWVRLSGFVPKLQPKRPLRYGGAPGTMSPQATSTSRT